jgi:dipeptidyl aminopeptidase/acylaminoacyl peptidase
MLAKLELPDRAALSRWREGRPGGGRLAAWLPRLGLAGLGLAAIAAAGLGFAVLGRPDHGPASDIALVAATPDGSQLYLLDPATSRSRPIGPPLDGDVQDLAWSPDRSSLAYYLRPSPPPNWCPPLARCPAPFPPQQLRELSLADARDEILAEGLEHNQTLLAWSPDGALFAQNYVPGGSASRSAILLPGPDLRCGEVAVGVTAAACLWYPETGDGPWEIRVVPMTGGVPAFTSPAVTIFPDGGAIWVRISPDGRWVTWNRGGDYHQLLARLPSPLAPSRLSAFDILDLGHGNDARWSPDSTRFVFLRRVSAAGELPEQADFWVYDVRTGIASPLTDDLAGEWSAAWSPDGQQIAFLSDRDRAEGDAYVANADGTGLRRLTNTPEYKALIAWATR